MASAPVSLRASATFYNGVGEVKYVHEYLEYGNLGTSHGIHRPSFFGIHSSNHLRAILDGLGCVKGTLLAC